MGFFPPCINRHSLPQYMFQASRYFQVIHEIKDKKVANLFDVFRFIGKSTKGCRYRHATGKILIPLKWCAPARAAEALKKGCLRAYPPGKWRREGVNIAKRNEKWDRSAGYIRTEVFQVILHIFFHNFWSNQPILMQFFLFESLYCLWKS